MKRRGRRIALAAVTAGLAVVIALGISYRDVVRDHVQAWRYQRARETMTLEPDPEDPDWIEGLKARDEATEEDLLDTAALPQALANSSGVPVILDAARRWEWDPVDIPWGKRDFATATILEAAREVGLRVIEQRLPRRAYVILQKPPDEE